jgi:hypothetical protein
VKGTVVERVIIIKTHHASLDKINTLANYLEEESWDYEMGTIDKSPVDLTMEKTDAEK